MSVNSRLRELERRIRTIEKERADQEKEFNRRLKQLSDEYTQKLKDMQTQTESYARRRIEREIAKAKQEYSDMLVQTQNYYRRQDERKQKLMDELQEETKKVQTQFEAIKKESRQRDETNRKAAEEGLRIARKTIEVCSGQPCEYFEPGQLDNVSRHYASAEMFLTERMYEASLSSSNIVDMEADSLKNRVVQKFNEFQIEFAVYAAEIRFIAQDVKEFEERPVKLGIFDDDPNRADIVLKYDPGFPKQREDTLDDSTRDALTGDEYGEVKAEILKKAAEVDVIEKDPRGWLTDHLAQRMNSYQLVKYFDNEDLLIRWLAVKAAVVNEVYYYDERVRILTIIRAWFDQNLPGYSPDPSRTGPMGSQYLSTIRLCMKSSDEMDRYEFEAEPFRANGIAIFDRLKYEMDLTMIKGQAFERQQTMLRNMLAEMLSVLKRNNDDLQNGQPSRLAGRDFYVPVEISLSQQAQYLRQTGAAAMMQRGESV